MAVSKKQALSKTKVAALAERWQRCLAQNLPDLFYAFIDGDGLNFSARLVTYRLEGKQLEQFYLLASMGKATDLRLIVHLGLKKDYLSDEIPKQPHFSLMIQPYFKQKDWQSGCFALNWTADSRFNIGPGVNSGPNAIPAAGAYLFVHSWMELPEEDLHLPFESTTHALGRRVQAYIFSNAESLSILADVKRSIKSGVKCLDIHLGNGMAVYSHPFSFRPVIEVKGGAPQRAEKRNRKVSGMEDDDGDSYYDYGGPIPPNLPD